MPFRPYRWLAFAACCGLLVAWAVVGPGVAERAGPPATAAAWNRKLLADLRREDPATAAHLDGLKSRGALAALDYVGTAHGTPGLRALAEERKREHTPATVALAELVAALDADDRATVLTAHGATLEALAPDADAAREYATWLEAARRDPETWRAAKDDPVALLVFRDVTDPALRQFYLDQRDWLAEPLVQLLPAGGVTGDKPQLSPVIAAAKQYFPHTKEAVATHGTGALGLQLFLEHGPAIDRCVRVARLPLDETLDVVFANRDLLATLQPAQAADLLIDTHRAKPHAWKSARHFPLTLRLVQDAPAHADALAERYAADGAIAFLYGHYEPVLPLAAEAVVKYGDLALMVLSKYRGEPRFPPLLKSLGVRAVPYLAQFGDGGFDRVEANRAWLDKYFAADGKPKEAEWWTHVPIVGAPVNVVRNWTTGTPNEWGELGWAAWDVADGVLLVATLGASSEVSVAVKATEEAAKRTAVAGAVVAGEAALEEGAEIALKRTARSIARTEAREMAAQGLKVGTRRAAREAFERGLSESLLRRASRLLAEGAYGAGRAFAFGGRVIAAPALKAAELARGVWRTWQSVPPTVRRWVVRGLLAAGLYVSVRERVLPNLPAIVGGMTKLASDAGRVALEQLTKGLQESLGKVWGGAGAWRWQQWAWLLGPPAGLAGLAYWLLPLRRRGLRYV